MLYPKTKELTPETFAAPGKEYRAAPFWAWTGELDPEDLTWQIEKFREMGFGGFHMHVRSGLVTPYLGDKFMNAINACVEKAGREDMLAYLYDEDRWPSGFAGGLVTGEHPEYRKRHLSFSPTPVENALFPVGRYEVRLNADGTLASYRLLAEGEEVPADRQWFAAVCATKVTPRYNNAGYVDTLNPKAIRCFLDSTHEKYKARFGEKFGGRIPSIFSDEPQFSRQNNLPFSDSREECQLPWTDDLPETYRQAYGEDLVARLPELVWNLPGDAPSATRWRYHDHVCERFVSAFSGTIGEWCDRNGLLFTGHVMGEGSLNSQTIYIGDAMRFYRHMSLPGIDMLCGYHELLTIKQAESAVRQYGREGLMSELYGVLGWDLDFRGHKHHGDWQAALGVTLRVPHLALSTMAGEAKRDYPQTIHYQSPWYHKYSVIEDHFARVNTALTRGQAAVKIAVVHPMESFWLHSGVTDRNAARCEQIEKTISDVTSWLLLGTLDFDYLCEALLPELCPVGGNPLRVGKCAYDAVIVPACETLRSTTLARLEEFRAAGGRLIFLGDAPVAADAVPDPRAKELYERSEKLPLSRATFLDALEPLRDVEIRNADGKRADNLFCQLREDGEDKWFFLAHAFTPAKPDIPKAQEIKIRFRGRYAVDLYDTMTGEIRAQEAEISGGMTEVKMDLYEYDSVLFRLRPGVKQARKTRHVPQKTAPASISIAVPGEVAYALDEPNVLLLDGAEYALDGGTWQGREEMLRLDTACRKQLGWPVIGGGAEQPWCVPPETECHKVSLRFTVESEIAYVSPKLAMEHPEKAEIRFNGERVSNEPVGYYADKNIKVLALPALRRGKNLLEIDCLLEKRIPLEWCYLLGEFGVRLAGRRAVVTKLPRTLGFGSIVNQGLPFYSGKLVYRLPVSVPRKGMLEVRVPQYRAALLGVTLDGGEEQPLAFSPYSVSVPVMRGKHAAEISAYINRTNTFGAVHRTDRNDAWIGPGLWRTSGDRWTYEYELAEEGILHSPTVELK